MARRRSAPLRPGLSLRALRAALDASPVATVLFDGAERVLLLNPAAEALFGRVVDRRAPLACGDLIGCANRHEHRDGCGSSASCASCEIRRAIRAALADEASAVAADGEARVLLEGSRDRWLRYRVRRADLGAAPGAIMAVEDVTEHRAADERLRLQSLVLDQIQDRVTITDLDGRITYVNEAGLRMIGRTAEELAGRSVEVYGEDPDRGATQRRIIEATREHGEWRGEMVNFAADGREVILDSRTRLVRDAAGKPVALCGISTEITERKRNERTLRAMAHVLDSAPSSITVHDAEGRFLYANERTLQMHGYRREEFLALGLRDVDAPASAALIAERMKLIAERGEASFEVEHLRKDGSRLPLEVFVKSVEWAGKPALLSIGTDITERRRAQAERERLLSAIEQSSDAIVITDASGLVRYANAACRRLAGPDGGALVGRTLDLLDPAGPYRELVPSIGRVLAAGTSWHGRLSSCEAAGSPRSEDATISPIRDISGTVSDYVVVRRDVTQQLAVQAQKERLEAQFQQAQKLESVGRLAGGVAHDLNNLLSPILGYGEILAEELGENDLRRSSVVEILEAARRARDVIRRLLAFSRKQILELRPVDLNALLERFAPLLRHTIRESIAIAIVPEPSLPPVKGDVGQLEQVVMNLAVNAQDAMPAGGTLTIGTAVVVVGAEEAARRPGIPAGRCVLLRVADTGVGMDDETLAHLFEPFFTTKAVDKGTGLGLATSYGIVKQHGGGIAVSSSPGGGTLFEIYLPATEPDGLAPAPEASPAPARGRGSETILIVEDDEQVRRVAAAMLEREGYAVLTAPDGESALGLLASRAEPVHLLLTDVVMPQMNGRELHRRVAERFSGVRALYMSGYADDLPLSDGVQDEGIGFIRKPFTPKALAAKVREALDAAQRPAP